MCRDALQAVAAVLQDDLSAVVTLKSSGIDRPQKLDGRRYASYGARCGLRALGAACYAEVPALMLCGSSESCGNICPESSGR